MKFHIDIHIHQDNNESKEILSKLNLILSNQNKTMALIDDLNAKVAELQAAVDAEQEQIAALLSQNAATITGLNEQIAALTVSLAAGATPEQLQAVIDGLTVIKTDVEGTV